MELASYQPKGMRLDESFLNFDKNYALENKNIRISTTGLNSKYSLTNERGNKKCTLNYVDIDPSKNEEKITLEGTVIGEAKVGKYWVIFTTGTLVDRIYRLELTDEDTFEVRLLIEDDLNFDVKHPLETVSYVETENIQKVYWVDGKNQLRILNIVDEDILLGKYKNNYMDAIRTQEFKEVVSINKFAGSGIWSSGTVQYVCTYVSAFGLETNPFYISPLHYLTLGVEATNVEDSASCFFNITITNLDDSYKYIRVYSIVRPTLGNPIVKLIAEVEGEHIQGYIYNTSTPLNFFNVNYIDGWNSVSYSKQDQEQLKSSTIRTVAKEGFENIITSNPGNLNIYIFKEGSGLNECYFYGYYDENSIEKTWYKRTYNWSTTNLFDLNYELVTINNEALNTNSPEYLQISEHIEEIADLLNTIDSSISLLEFVLPLCIDKGIPYKIVYQHIHLESLTRMKVGFLENNPSTVIEKTETKEYINHYGRTIGNKGDSTERSEAFILNYPIWLYNYKEVANVTINQQLYESTEHLLDENFLYSPVFFDKITTKDNTTYYVSKANRFINRKFEALVPALNPEKEVVLVPKNKDIFEVRPGSVVDSLVVSHKWTVSKSETETNNRTILKDYLNKYNLVLYELEADYIGIKLNDTNKGEIVDSTYPLYVGGYPIKPYTIDHKDNTLFLGNLEIPKVLVSLNLLENIKNQQIEFHPSISREYTSSIFYEPDYDNTELLKSDNSKITHFKTGETYRFGVILLHNTGVWSLPIFIKDVTVPQPLFETHPPKVLFLLPHINLPKLIIEDIKNEDFVGIKPVVVLPDETNRTIVCLGILCPTVYNRGKRKDLTCHALLSWIPRFKYSNEGSLILHNTLIGKNEVLNSKYYEYLFTLNDNLDLLKDGYIKSFNNSKFYTWNASEENNNRANDYFYVGVDLTSYYEVTNNEESKYINLRKPNSESGPSDPSEGLNVYKDDNSIFVIDELILTLHSPEIEFNEFFTTLDLSTSTLSIVGGVPFVKSYYTYYLLSGSPIPGEQGTIPEDFGYNKEIKSTSGEIPKIIWKDYSYKAYVKEVLYSEKEYNINIWQATGPINNSFNLQNKSSSLERKIFSNTHRLSFPYWTSLYKIEDYTYNITSPKYCDTNSPIVLIDNPNSNSTLTTLIYQGNVDTIINTSTTIREDTVGSWSYLKAFDEDFTRLDMATSQVVSMKYKCTPHLVFGMLGTNIQLILPGYINDDTANSIEVSIGGYYYDKNITGYRYDKYLTNYYNSEKDRTPIVYIGELRRNIESQYANNGLEYSTNWVTAGNIISMPIDNSEYCTVIYDQGDTYYQRYDCLLALPFDSNDLNLVVSIMSFMCETHINIDGRYDKNKGLEDNTHVTDKNFNLINLNYTLNNNYFTYHTLPERELKLTYFPQQFTWTKTKRPGATVDTWANITLASTMDLNGDLGPLRAIRNYNGNLIAFLDRGIAWIKYNSNVALETAQGVPVELANSGKVDGTLYISNNVGCKNKWSIAFLKDLLYFIDSANKDLYTFSDKGVVSVSLTAGMESWSSANIDDHIWDLSEDNKTIKVLSDNLNNEILLTSKDFCLAFNQSLDIEAFTSFYDYQGTSFMLLLEGNTYTIKDGNIWRHNAGNYNEFYEELKPFWTKILVNDKPFLDKIFDVLEFRSDSYKYKDNEWKLVSDTFTDLIVENEYLFGSKKLDTKTLKRKFRIWRTHIPRDSKNNLKGRIKDRMRNTWLKLTLKGDPSEGTEYNKTVLHDLTVHYT